MSGMAERPAVQLQDDWGYDYLTHYYKNGTEPFRSLSYLPDDEVLRVSERFQNETALVYRRFKDPVAYLTGRRETEAWVRSGFIAKGGRPEIEYPYYMVLGESSYIFDGYDRDCKMVRIPLDSIDPAVVSFTYPDSMVSRWVHQYEKEKEYYNPELHGQVFLLGEIMDLVGKYGIPDGEWENDPARAYDFFIEAQVWSKAVIENYCSSSRSIASGRDV